VGGAGKTPFVIWLAGELERMGLRTGVAMRGYKGAGGRAAPADGRRLRVGAATKPG
jgi:tetraacyldisaccharide-1-P 4'-kinase